MKRFCIISLICFFCLNNNVNAQNAGFLWAKGMCNGGWGNSISVDAAGNVYATGAFQGTVDFDPGPGTYYMTSAGGRDIFVAKLNASGNLLWAKQMGSVGNEDFGNSIDIDAIGNVYTTGNFKGITDFDPGNGTYTLTSTGEDDIFVSKLDPSGNFLWAKQMGGANSSDIGYSIAIDVNGNVCTTGLFTGIADFDPGSGTYNMTSTGGWEIFVSKLDASGNLLWAKQMGGTGNDRSNSIALDAYGNVYTTGSFQGTADFDPGTGTYNLTSNNADDIFISKLDVSGNFLWAKQFGGGSQESSTSIAIDLSGNVHTTGWFNGTVDFDPGTGTYNLASSGTVDIFVSKLDPSGNFLWAKQIDISYGGAGNSITVDANGNVYTTGSFQGTADFDPGPGTNYLSSSGSGDMDIFVSKLDPSGNLLWAKQMGGTGQETGYSIALDPYGNVYTTGAFLGTSDFDPGPETYNLTSVADLGVFVVKFKGDPIVYTQPKLYTTKALLNVGETQTITGKDFTTGGQVNLFIQSSNGDLIPVNTITYLPNGGFSYQLPITSTMPNGEYSVYATDINTGQTTTTLRFRVNNNSTTSNYLKITSPNVNISSKTNSPIKIEWSDKPSHISTLIPNTSKVNASYKIEYNRDNTGWQLIEIKSYPAFFQQVSSFHFTYSPNQTGVFKYRVTDMLDAGNNDISATVTVNTDVSGVVMNYAWDYSGNRPPEKPIGLAADGTARIYVKVLKKVGNPKTISNVSINITDPIISSITDARLLGKLMKATDINSYSTEANTANLTSVNSNISGPGNIFWFWYVAPDDFVRENEDNFSSTRYLRLAATVTYSDNTTDPISEEIEIVRPPLMFVHGIGGDETTWDNFYYRMNGVNRYFLKESDSRWKFRKALNMYPGGSYKQNAQLLLNLTANGQFNLNADLTENYKNQSFQYFLKQMRDKKYASNRVDYVAHSMGGDMARAAINYSLEYQPNESIHRKFKNYGTGFINKFITLNTPHNGSPFADILIEKISKYKMFKTIVNAYNKYSNEAAIFRAMFNQEMNSENLDYDSPTDAAKNLQSGINGVKLNQSIVKNHLISGDIVIEGGDCEPVYSQLRSNSDVSGLLKLLHIVEDADYCFEINNLFQPYGYTNFFDNGDAIVPLSSQLPNKVLSGSGNDYTIYYGPNANHLSIDDSNENPPVGQKVFNLLNAPINSINFADNIAANNTPGSEVYRPTSLNSISEHIDTNKIIITQPLRDSILAIDSSIVISVNLKDTTNFKFLNLLFQNNIYTSASKIYSQSFNVQVNPLMVNSQTIVATAAYDSLGTNIYYTDTLSAYVQKDSVLYGFYITPKIKYLNSGQVYTPGYNLIHNTYISNVSISDTALHIAIADTNVVNYSTGLSSFVAKDTGTTYAVISYKQFKDTLFIYIGSPSDENITNACSQGNISFFAGTNDNTKTYQWQVDTGTEFINISDNSVYSGTSTPTLTLTGVPSSLYGYKYQCLISDAIGTVFGPITTLKFSSTWTGATDNAWENPANWSCGAMPDSNTDIVISSTAARFPEVNSNVTCRSLTVQPGATVIVKSGFKIDITGQNE